MADLALDYSWTHPPISQLVEANVKDILVYTRVSTPPREYLEDAVAAGIGVCAIYEENPKRPWDGYEAGKQDAGFGVYDLQRFNYPEGCRLYVNMSDTPNVAGEEDNIAEYARGWGEAFPDTWLLGAYGAEAAILAARRGHRRFDALWAVETWYPHSNGHPDVDFEYWKGVPGVVLVQMANVPPPIDGTDTNWIIDPALGAWGGEDDMAISDEQMNTLGKWMQDQRNVMLQVLIGDNDPSKDRAVLAGWENDTRAQVIAADAASRDELLKAINAIPAGEGESSTGAPLDPVALAHAIADALGDVEAKKVADILAARLAK